MRQQFSLVPMVTHVTTWLMLRHQQKEKCSWEFNFKFSEQFQAVANYEPKDITDPSKTYMFVQELFNQAISSKTIQQAHLTLQKAKDSVQKIEREFLLVGGIQQTEFDTVMLIDTTTGNDPIRQQRSVTITCYKCGQKGHYRKDCPNWTSTSPVPDQIPAYSVYTTVTQTVAVSYVVPHSSLVTILKEFMNWQLRKSIQQMPWKQLLPPSKAVVTKTSAIGKKTVWFTPKTTPSRPVKIVTQVWKLTSTIAKHRHPAWEGSSYSDWGW